MLHIQDWRQLQPDMIAGNSQLGLKTRWDFGHTAQDGTADAVAAQFAELPGKQVVDAPDAPTLGAPTPDAPTFDAPTLDAPTLDAPTLDAPDPIIEHDTSVGAALTQLQTALAEVITALSEAAGHAVITQGTAALEIDAYVDGLHWQA
jgi:hypothetical protein